MTTYDIKISGHNDLLAVPNGDEMKADWERYKTKKTPDTPVSIENWTGMLSDIKWFRVAKASRADDDGSIRVDKEYHDDLKKIRAMTAYDRSKRLGFFRVIHMGFTGEQPSEETLASARSVQEKFFTENPLRTLPNPECFKDMFDGKKLMTSAFRVIDSHIHQDIFAVKYL